MRHLFFTAIASFFVLSYVGCKKGITPEEQAAKDNDLILSYISSKNYEAKELSNGVYVVITDSSNFYPRTYASPYDVVRVNYRGYLLNESEFDGADGIEFSLQSVIRGWTIGIPAIPIGGSGILLIPSGQGYGTQAAGDIPANSVLVFEVDVIKVVN